MATKFPCAFISARFDGGHVEQTMRKVHQLLCQAGYDVAMVEASVGDNFGDMTALYLDKIESENGVLVAVCTQNYGEITASQSSTHEELRYCDSYGIQVLPLRMADVYPPQPPFGADHPYDKKGLGKAIVKKLFKPSLLNFDCRGKTAEEIAVMLAGRLQPQAVGPATATTATTPAPGGGLLLQQPGGALEAPLQAALACGSCFSVAPRPDGSLHQWGRTECGESEGFPAGEKGFRALACGQYFSVALKPDGSLHQWGCTKEDVREGFPAGEKGFRALACGVAFSVALRPDGSLHQWGRTKEDVREGFPAGEKGFKALACGAYFSVALRPDGSLHQWGHTDYDEREGFPAGEKGFRALACGGTFAVALRPDGSLHQWGRTGNGQRQGFPAGEKGFKALACGMDFSVALRPDGSLHQWGYLTTDQREDFPAGQCFGT